MMAQRISVLTIAADNLQAMKAFYEEKLGWTPVAENKDIIFYKMNGFLLSIGKRKEMAEFIGIPSSGNGFRAITLGYNVEREEEVLVIYERLKSKGVKILKEPTIPPFGGLFFYFEDIEGNILEVACNHYVLLDEALNAVGHKDIGDL